MTDVRMPIPQCLQEILLGVSIVAGPSKQRDPENHEGVVSQSSCTASDATANGGMPFPDF